MELTPEQLAPLIHCPVANVASHWPRIRQCLDALGMSGHRCYIAALATVAVETAHQFLPIHEFGKRSYFDKYDHRTDLGNAHPGDGYKYRGAGFIQITGEANFAAYGKLLGIDLIDDPNDPNDDDDPNKTCDPDVAASILAAYFRDHKIGEAAGLGAWTKVRKLVNGGTNGLEDFLGCVQRLESSLS